MVSEERSTAGHLKGASRGLVRSVGAGGGASGLTDDADEQTLVDEAVGDGGGRGRVVEEVTPVLEGQIRGDDGGGTQVALVDDLVEQVGASGVEAQVSELVDEEQVVAGPGGEALAEGVAGLGCDQVVDEIGGEGEADAVAFDAGEVVSALTLFPPEALVQFQC